MEGTPVSACETIDTVRDATTAAPVLLSVMLAVLSVHQSSDALESLLASLLSQLELE